MGKQSRGTHQATGIRTCWNKRKSKSFGARAAGASRKNEFQWAVDELKQWVATKAEVMATP